MTKRVRLTPRARDDIIEGALYIAGDNPDAAERFLAAVERTFETLAHSPHIGASRTFADPRLELPLELAVVAFFHCIKEIGGGMHLAIVFDVFISFYFNDLAIIQFELISRVFQIFFFHQYSLKCLRIEPEGCTSLETLFIGI